MHYKKKKRKSREVNEKNLEKSNLPLKHLNLGRLPALSIQIWILRRRVGVGGGRDGEEGGRVRVVAIGGNGKGSRVGGHKCSKRKKGQRIVCLCCQFWFWYTSTVQIKKRKIDALTRTASTEAKHNKNTNAIQGEEEVKKAGCSQKAGKT